MTGEPVLQVNPIACAGRGLCAEIAPELITMDDWGFPIIEQGPIPPGLVAGAQAAVRICPLLALRLRDHGAGGEHDPVPTSPFRANRPGLPGPSALTSGRGAATM